MVRCLLIALTATLLISDIGIAGDREILTATSNPLPGELPTLGVWQEYVKNKDIYYTLISADFPNVPGLVCDMWCYESPGIHYLSAREEEKGVVSLRHRWDDHDWDIITTAIPHKGAVEIMARLESTQKHSGGIPEEYPGLNICWQLRRAESFSSEKGRYPEFVQRCFIFTERGRIFLHNTHRSPIPVRPLTDKENNPPWVQMYAARSAPEDVRVDSTSWADYSPDRYLHPIIGTASRDGKYLTAIATGSEGMVCQAWHDCMHNNARWLPVAEGEPKQWRVLIYAMDNDPDALLDQFQHDFPEVDPWQDN